MTEIAIVGGGAAGFFAAIAAARADKNCKVSVFERTSQFLSKVRISGGGRCNVTHALFDPRMFTEHYPRGERELISAFHRFSADDTIAWFEARGVRLKREDDGRMFPVTDSSETVVDCLVKEATAAGVRLFTGKGIEGARLRTGGRFELKFTDGKTLECDRLLLATGGCRNISGAVLARSLGHTIEPPVPSLFSLHIPAVWLHRLAGISVSDVLLSVGKLTERGALLITHNGISGPAVLRLSAWGARILHDNNYRFSLSVNWLPDLNETDLRNEFQSRRKNEPSRRVNNSPIGGIPARLWENLVSNAGVSPNT
ncbi:MAG TPA: aminoacetone oxidase family FAD-binding enzyme, partial [Chthoniobacterales bacterium]|nr:aminoacetone oxidase family FAD-binding enzyme [Chthoniobacterales bacterium]